VNPEQVPRLVSEVISRLAPRLGADGRRGSLVVAFSGGTASFAETLRQCRLLVLDGYRLRLAFSAAAEQLFGSVVRQGLDGFPHVDQVDPVQWLGELLESRAVLCPMLSVNTLSKVSLLTADGLVPNLLLHGLFMGKPAVLARDGVALDDEGRRDLGIDQATPALRQALDDRLRTVAGYGCRITDVRSLHATVNSVLVSSSPRAWAGALPAGQLITAADVRRAHRADEGLSLSPSALVTPLARDLAMQLGVRLTRNGGELQ